MILESVAVIGSIAASAKSVVDLAKNVKELATGNGSTELANKSAKLLDTTINLRAMIIDLQDAVLALQAENSALKKKLVDIEQCQHDLEKYRLIELAPGVFVYCLDPAENDGNPTHYLCASCFTQGKKSILQLSAQAIGGHFYRCHSCNSEICDHSKKRDVESPIVCVNRSSRWGF